MNLLPHSATVIMWLTDLTFQSTAWLGILWLGLRCVQRLSASRRHLLLTAGLLTLPVLMLGSLRPPAWSIPVVLRVEAAPTAIVNVGGQLSMVAVPSTMASRSAINTSAFIQWHEILLLVWLAGMIAGIVGLAVTFLRLRSLRRASAVVSDSRLRECWRQACEESDVTAETVTLRESVSVSVPMTWGVRRPIVLLPAKATDWPDEQIMIVLRHELAHFSRRDVQVTLWSVLLALPLWFHPLVWLVWRDCHHAREAACDDLAMQRSGVSTDVFARRLLDAVTHMSCRPTRRLMPLALCMAEASVAALRERLSALLNDRLSRAAWSPWQTRGIVLALGIGAVLISGLSACREAKPAVISQIVIASKVISIPVGSKSALSLAAAFAEPTAPGLQMRGILDEPQAAALLRQLDDNKDVQILSTPTVTTRSGQKATVEITREFIYPTAFDAPKIEKDKPLIPTTPTAFEMRPVGVRIEFVPQMAGHDIELEISPEYTRFLGFVDYGAPIRSEITGPDGKVRETLVSENKIQQPVFHSMKSHMSAMLKERQFLVIGGLGDQGSSLASEKPSPAQVANLEDDSTKHLIYFIIQAKARN